MDKQSEIGDKKEFNKNNEKLKINKEMLFLKEIYANIDENLKLAVQNNRLKSYYLDWNYDQLQLGGQTHQDKPPISFPAIFIASEKGANFELNGQGSQQADVTINIFVAFSNCERTNSISTHREVALQHLDELEIIYKTISGTSGNNFSQLYLSGFYKTKRVDYKIYELTFKCTVYAQFKESYLATIANANILRNT